MVAPVPVSLDLKTVGLMQRLAPDIADESGFTLVELIVVLLVLAIVSAYALPRFFDLDDYRARGDYDEVAGAVRYAQKLAVASGCEVQVDLSGNGYDLQQHETDCTSGSFTTIVNHPVTQNTFSGISLSSTPATFRFDAMGRCSSNVSVTVGGRSFAVIAETGYVEAP